MSEKKTELTETDLEKASGGYTINGVEYMYCMEVNYECGSCGRPSVIFYTNNQGNMIQMMTGMLRCPKCGNTWEKLRDTHIVL